MRGAEGGGAAGYARALDVAKPHLDLDTPHTQSRAANGRGEAAGLRPSASAVNSGPDLSMLLDQRAEEGADKAARRYLIPSHVVAKGVQLTRLQRQRAAAGGW